MTVEVAARPVVMFGGAWVGMAGQDLRVAHGTPASRALAIAACRSECGMPPMPGNAVMLVHAATAPIRRPPRASVLAKRPVGTQRRSGLVGLRAIHAAYASAKSAPPAQPAATAADAFDRAAPHGDEHVIKLADTALDTYSWTGDTQALAAIETAASLIDPW